VNPFFSGSVNTADRIKSAAENPVGF